MKTPKINKTFPPEIRQCAECKQAFDMGVRRDYGRGPVRFCSRKCQKVEYRNFLRKQLKAREKLKEFKKKMKETRGF